MRAVAYKLLMAACIISVGMQATAQKSNHPPACGIYTPYDVPRVDITLAPGDLQQILTNVQSYTEYPADFQFTRNGIMETVYNVGFRLRGNTSRWSGKKSFKVSFNAFSSGARWRGVKKLNLNGEHNDPSILRARIAWNSWEDAGLPSCRVNHVELYINGAYYGVYANVEHINDDFVEHRFEGKAGNLYKCLWPADLAYLGNNPDLYKLQSSGRRVYDLMTNTASDDYSGLAKFIVVLHQTPSAQLKCALDSVFDVNSYLQQLAMEIIVGHWDNHSVNRNNYYLYENPENGLMTFLTYDLDNTMGIDWGSTDWSTKDFDQWSSNWGTNHLYQKIMSVTEYRDRLDQLIQSQMEPALRQTAWYQRNTQWRSQIAPHVGPDTYHSLDYGYDSTTFWNALNQASGSHVKWSVHDYMGRRWQAMDNQLSTSNLAPIVMPARVAGHSSMGPIRLGVQVWDEGSPVVTVSYQWNQGNSQTLTLYDDGQHHDGQAGDGFYGGDLVLQQSSAGTLSYQIQAVDSLGLTAHWPCTPKNIDCHPVPAVLINEIMSKNDNALDIGGTSPDWIEIHNLGSSQVNLSELYLTDDDSLPTLGSLGMGTLGAQQSQFWVANDAAGVSTMELPFRVKSSGETIRLYHQSSTGTLTELDAVRTPPLIADVSWGRRWDGVQVWSEFEQPSPSGVNPGDVSQEEWTTPEILTKAYPSPFRTWIAVENFSGQHMHYTWHNALGQTLGKGMLSTETVNVLRCPTETQGWLWIAIRNEQGELIHTHKVYHLGR